MNMENIKILLSSRDRILKRLRTVIKGKNFSYRTFGTEIEESISEELIRIFKEEGLIKRESDFKIAPDKNHFPDFELNTSGKRIAIAIEYKSGNRNKISKGKWVKASNSNNDLGTFYSWPRKIKKFGGENIFYIFIVYNINQEEKEIEDVQIDHFYKFVGIQKNGLLKYREKDGNLRPRNFYEKSPLKTFEDFKGLFRKTLIYRSKRIISKHRKIIKVSEEL
ncbi:hypothetical protein D4R51_01355 [bacterium]|nr:MAG: hypothetical protein D4R51_01355 [bacterium]